MLIHYSASSLTSQLTGNVEANTAILLTTEKVKGTILDILQRTIKVQ